MSKKTQKNTRSKTRGKQNKNSGGGHGASIHGKYSKRRNEVDTKRFINLIKADERTAIARRTRNRSPLTQVINKAKDTFFNTNKPGPRTGFF